MTARNPEPGELCEMIENGDIDIAETMLEHGADPNERGSGESALHIAIICADIEFIKLIVEKGADLEARNEYGQTPLIYAVRYNYDALDFLIEKGVALNTKDNDGNTALDWATIIGVPEPIEKLKKAFELQQQAAVKFAREAAEAEQKRIAALRSTAAAKQAALRKLCLKPMRLS